MENCSFLNLIRKKGNLIGNTYQLLSENMRPNNMKQTRRKKPIEVRFMKFVEKDQDGCWNWKGHIARKGYGSFHSKERLAHRVSYLLFKGELIKNLTIDHLCRNRKCVNPDHLEQVTSKENRDRGLCGILRTHCSNGHEFSKENTYLYPNARNKRVCKTCKKEQSRKASLKRKETNQLKMEKIG